MLGVTAIVVAAYYIGGGGGESDTVYIVILVLLGLAAVHTYVKRKTSKPPAWMGKLENASPGFSFRLGFLLLGVFPTDILTSFAVGSFLANKGEPLWHCLIFVAVTLLLLSLPALLLVVFRERGEAFLPKARDWMNTNSWVVNEVVIVFFIVITASSLA